MRSGRLLLVFLVVGALVAWRFAPGDERDGITDCLPGNVCLVCEGELSLDQVHHVELDPGEVLTDPGSGFRIDAVPVLENGLPVRATSPSWIPIPVIWGSLKYLGPQEGFALFSTPDDAEPEKISGISARVSGFGFPGLGHVLVGPMTGQGASFIRIPHYPGAPPEAVLQDWPEAEDCSPRASRGMAVAGTAWLEDSANGKCRSSAWVFTRGAGVRREQLPSPSTKAPAEAVASEPPPERVVLVRFRLNFARPADPTEFEYAWAKSRALADRHFSANRTGIRFDWSQKDTLLEEVADGFTGCEDDTLKKYLGIPVTKDKARDGKSLDQHEAWVVFVPSIDGQFAGYTCAQTPRRGPVIVMSAAHFNPTTLTHELGHMLGMGEHMAQDGHTGKVPGFTPANVMWSAPELCTGMSRERFSLGQLYRMNVDSRSWIWLKTPETSSSWPTDWKRECQPDSAEGTCPALATDYPRGETK
ncbi:MAG TPA: hypothetical protein VLH75_00785 [Longimicrobiales bacterium]|nr:hypothetical protein [Longimicrobiales bacterium]